MFNFIGRKLKGLVMSKKKDESVSDNSQALDADENTDVLDAKDTPENEGLTEAPVVSDSIPEIEEEIAEEPVQMEAKAEKTHERVSRIAAEMNTKGYGL